MDGHIRASCSGCGLLWNVRVEWDLILWYGSELLWCVKGYGLVNVPTLCGGWVL